MNLNYSPVSPAARVDPYPFYAALRRQAPVYFVEDIGAWAISRYEDVHFVLSHPELFSSDAMHTMFVAPPSAGGSEGDAATAERLAAIAAALPFTIEEMIAARNLISTDPPAHEMMRKIVSRGFTPRRIAAYESRARQVVARCLRRLHDGGEFDVVEDLAVPLPTVIIAEMLGVEAERHDDFRRWSDTIIAQATGSGWGRPFAETGYLEAMRELGSYLLSVIDRRRRRPEADLITALVAAQDGESVLTPMEVFTFTILLLVAGNETTTNLIGNAVNALLDHPDQLARVVRHRELLPAVVEETVRWQGPIQFVFRRVRKSVSIAGTTLPGNAVVMPLLGSANRDERQFPRAEEFDVTRDTGGHLGFGIGVHYCLGASLARLEARVALAALLDELPGLCRRPAPVDYIDSFLIRGPRRLPLRRRPDGHRLRPWQNPPE